MEQLDIPLTEAIARFAAHQTAANHSAKTKAHYASTFNDFAAFLAETGQPATLAALTSETIRAFGAWLTNRPSRGWRGRTRYSIQTIHSRLRDLRAFCRFLAAEELLAKVPRFELPKLPQDEFHILSAEQRQQLFACHHLTAPGPQAVRNRALLALMIDTGIRRAEAAAIRLADLELRDNLIQIRGKGSKERKVPISSGVKELLLAWLAVRGEDPSQPLFWLTSAGIYSLFQRIQRETGLPVHPHMLRHQAATMLVNNRADHFDVARILGHADLETTRRYVNQSYEELRERHQVASPFETIRLQLQPVKEPKRKRLSLS